MAGKSLISVVTIFLVLTIAPSHPAAQARPTLVLLDRYAAGEFAAAADAFAKLDDFKGLLKDLHSDDLKKWLDAGGPDDRNRRRLAAATFALEAARADEWSEWKWIQKQTTLSSIGLDGSPKPGGQSMGKLPVLYWLPPPLLIEWGCELLRQDEAPQESERLWQLAAMSVAQRGEDTQFLMGFTEIVALDEPDGATEPAPAAASLPPGPFRGTTGSPAARPIMDEVLNVQKEIGHLNHVAARFPAEKRFMLGQALTRERPSPDDAIKIYKTLIDDRDVGAEASVRLGALYVRRGKPAEATDQFDRAERLTRDPDLLYLGRFYRGQLLIRSKRDSDAIAAFQAALRARPASQSASTALAALLVKAEKFTEAQAVMRALLDAGPDLSDPNIEYMHGDDHFWPSWIQRLHAAISPKAIHTSADPESMGGPSADADAVAATGEDRRQNPPAQQRPPVFTANVDAVFVDVSVRKGGRQLTGLTAADFELRDNGVKQDIDTIETSAVPIDLSIVVDVSGNPDRPWEKAQLPTASAVAADISGDVRQLTALLRPGDRVRLLAQDTYVQQLWPLQPVTRERTIDRVTFNGQSSLYDTLATLLLQPVETTRRHVIVAATKGLDTISAISANDVNQIAQHADAQLHVVALERLADEGASVLPWQCGNIDLCRASYRFWVPARRRLFPAIPVWVSGALHTLTLDGRAVQAGAQASGGDLYQGQMVSEPSLYGVFEKAFENFRQSYVLRYTPKGVTRAGWHQITVTMPNDKSVTIHARTGYGVDAPLPAPPATPPASDSTILTTLPDLMTAYERSDYAVVDRSLGRVVDLSKLIKDLDFEKGINPWPGSTRSEAVFALELAANGIMSRPPASQDAARALLQRYSRLIQPALEPDEFERAWLTAVLALLQGRISPALAEPFVSRALARFPNEPRFLLARAIVLDQQWRGFGTMTFDAKTTATQLAVKQGTEVLEAYEAAATASPEVAAEARIRGAWLLHRVGRSEEALKQLDAAPASPDPAIEYLRNLFRSHVYLAMGKLDEAAAAARAAHVIVPDAQSARVNLMNALLLKGDMAGAESVAENIETAPRTADPWWSYWLGDFRWFPAAVGRLREMSR